MRKFLTVLMIALLAGLAYTWFIPGPSILLGGPPKSEIVAVTRAALAGPPGTTTEADLATISPKGLCSKNDDGSFACIVEIALNDRSETLVSVLRKDASGAWVAAD
ncbi:MAG: hypothetical protein Q4G26_09240 [Paracoccus sp. (in: a-proteobacteria)]|nr:hypothetical protein [Paracoccus sp. (in: a-proteobacteria)]